MEQGDALGTLPGGVPLVAFPLPAENPGED